MNLITLVATLCNTLPGPSYCVPEAIQLYTTSQIECSLHGQEYLAQWMAGNPRYRHDWRVDRYRCVAGRYEVGSKT